MTWCVTKANASDSASAGPYQRSPSSSPDPARRAGHALRGHHQEARVEPHRAGPRRHRAAEIVEPVQVRRRAERQPGFLLQFAGGGDGQPARERRVGRYQQMAHHLGAQFRGGRGGAVAGVDRAAREHQVKRQEAVAGAAHAHQGLRAGRGLAQHDQAGGVARLDLGAGRCRRAKARASCVVLLPRARRRRRARCKRRLAAAAENPLIPGPTKTHPPTGPAA